MIKTNEIVLKIALHDCIINSSRCLNEEKYHIQELVFIIDTNHFCTKQNIVC